MARRISAAAVRGAPGDLTNTLKRRPGFAEVFEELIPDYNKRSEELLRERSAVYWSEKINTGPST